MTADDHRAEPPDAGVRRVRRRRRRRRPGRDHGRHGGRAGRPADAAARAVRLPRRRRHGRRAVHVLRAARADPRRGRAGHQGPGRRAARPAHEAGRPERAAPDDRRRHRGAGLRHLRLQDRRRRAGHRLGREDPLPRAGRRRRHEGPREHRRGPDRVQVRPPGGTGKVFHRRLRRRRPRRLGRRPLREGPAGQRDDVPVADVPHQRRRRGEGRPAAVAHGRAAHGRGGKGGHPHVPAQEADRPPAAQPAGVARQPHPAAHRRTAARSTARTSTSSPAAS